MTATSHPHARWRPRRSQLPSSARAWTALVVRFALIGLLVIAGDRLAGLLTNQGWRMELAPVIVIRVVTALPILRYPFEGFLLALEVDKWDWYWLGAGDRSAEYQALYQQWDKLLDLVTLSMAAIVVLRWQDRPMRLLVLTTFALRLGGSLAFLLTEQRWLLVAFPNVFELLFLMYVVFQILTPGQRMLEDVRTGVLVLAAALLPKVAEEYFLHMLERRPWDVVDLPVPHMIEPQIWLFAMYVPALLVVVVLVRRARRRLIAAIEDPALATPVAG